MVMFGIHQEGASATAFGTPRPTSARMTVSPEVLSSLSTRLGKALASVSILKVSIDLMAATSMQLACCMTLTRELSSAKPELYTAELSVALRR
jgi:hypothetical protein